ncbi:MAG: signal peptide peptidase SppA [bacterium]|nr:signal peptide peptidase SppA [bacterium]
MSRRNDLLILLIFVACFFVALYLIFGLFTPRSAFDNLSTGSGSRIALLQIVGPIYNPQPILDQLNKIEDSDGIKALLLRLDTPGGGVAAAQEIYSKLVYLRDEKKIPIVASMGSVAASGGYYIAVGADTIIANPGTITGSIGVIADLFNYSKLAEKIGLQLDVIKSGKFKDTGNPYRQITGEEREYLQGLIDDSYHQFVETVARERNMKVEDVELLADGRVYTGRQAKESGLIDLLGGYDDAVKLAAGLGGIKGKPRVVELKKDKKLTLYDLLFGDLQEIAYFNFGIALPLKYELPRRIP